MIDACGRNEYYQILPKSNHDKPQAKFSHELDIDPSLIASFSSFYCHSVYITTKGEIRGIGYNKDGRIISSLPKKILNNYTEFEIKNKEGHLMTPLSAVCGKDYSLYLVTEKKNGNKAHLAYSYPNIKTDHPLFLNIGEVTPVSLFGGYCHSAAIDDNGSILFIPNSISNSPKTKIELVSLPDDEEAVNIACCESFIVALSSTGKIYESGVKKGKLKFKEVEELKGKKIVFLNGLFRHCFVVTDEGVVYVKGEDTSGCLCLGEDVSSVSKFTKISSLSKYKIKAAFAGYSHSFFQTAKGKFLACGYNYYGQLHINEKKTDEYYTSPIETSIKNDVTFIIAGVCLTLTFDKEIQRMPNKVFKKFGENSELLKKYEEEIRALKEENEMLRKRLKSKKTNDEVEIIEQSGVRDMRRIEMIGRSSQSKVYKVARVEYYALKVYLMNKKSSSSKSSSKDSKKTLNSLNQLVRKCEIMNRVCHKNIIKTFGFCFGDENHSPSLLLEYCEYNLSDLVEELTDIQRVTAIYEISLAMKEVHAADLIHFDLKPENILFDDDKHVKVSDIVNSCVFDVSDLDNLKEAGIGTLKFMAPEILNESDGLTEKVDVYSFGVVVFFILSGGSYPKIKVREVADGKKAKIPKSMNKVARQLIGGCWSTEPDDRPSFEEIVDYIKDNKFKLIDGVEKSIKKINEFLSS